MSKHKFEIPKNKEDAKKRIEELKKKIRYNNRKYYIEVNPVISDYEYDQLYKELESLERTYPEYISEDSPTQRVGAEKIEEFETVEHKRKMLSLDKSNNYEDLRDFDEKIRLKIGEKKI